MALKKKASQLLDEACFAEESGNNLFAQELIDQAIAINPKHWYLWCKKAILLDDSGCIEEAKVAFKMSIDLNDKQALSWSLLGCLYYDEMNFEAAAHCCRTSLEILEDYSTLTILAGAEIQTGEVESALKHANRALELNPDWDEAESMRDHALRILARAE